MRRMAFGALLAAMLVSGPTFGAVAAEHRGMLSWQTGDNLFDMCLHEQGTEQLAFCIGYLVAVAEVTAYDQDACISKEVTSTELHDVVVQYLEEHSSVSEAPAHVFVYLALVRAFPCE